MLLGLLVVAVVWAAPASAHATLLFADPSIDGSVPSSPTVLTLVFDEPVTLAGAPLRVSDATGREASLGTVRQSNGGRVITAPVREQLPPGVYTVRWQVVSNDGDTMGSAYRFGVGATTSLGGAGPTSDQVSTPGLAATTGLRWLLFLALAVGLGGPVGAWLARRRASAGQMVPAAPVLLAAVMGAAASTGLALLMAGNGSLWAGITHPSLRALTDGRPGRLVLLELVGFAVAGALVAARKRAWAAVPLLAIVLAEALRAHAATTASGWGVLLTGAHVLAASIWVGALAQVVRTAMSWRQARPRAWALIGDYSRLAVWLFAAAAVTGLVTALLLVPWAAWTRTTYGRVLLVKLLLVAAVAVLALLARRRLRKQKGLEAPGAPPGRAAGLERVTLVVVLGVTALLVSLPPPRALGDTALPLPPPPVGLAVPMGARAGQIGVSATASAGQIVVHLSAPQLGATTPEDTDTTAYRLAGAVATEAITSRKLSWRPCGPGCFVAPVRWDDGANQITLLVGADGWAGGAVTVSLPWPTKPGADELRRVVARMRTVPSFTLSERVSSDTHRPPGIVVRLPMTGAAFLDSEPYGTGIAAQAAIVRSNKGGETTLRVGFPSARTQAELVVAADGRILRETLTAPDHWITRTFAYPNPQTE